MLGQEITIGKKSIGTYGTVFVIAEIGINHNGSVSQAKRLIEKAAECGADAVKFQSFRADRLLIRPRGLTTSHDPASESPYHLFARLELSWKAQEDLKRHADDHGILFLSTPFDEDSVDFLDSLGVAAFKIASADITHFPLLKHVASKGKPLLLSTGMSYLNEVADAVWTVKTEGAKEIIPLHCISTYPAPANSLNLRAIHTMQEKLDLPVGFSDHSQGILFSLLAAALGAVVLEKHFTLDKDGSGPDHRCSADPTELRELIRQLRAVESSLGDGRKCPVQGEEESRRVNRRRIVAAADIRAHELIAPWMLTFKRADSGLDPGQLDRIVGMRARRAIEKNEIVHWEHLSPTGYPETVEGMDTAAWDAQELMVGEQGESDG